MVIRYNSQAKKDEELLAKLIESLWDVKLERFRSIFAPIDFMIYTKDTHEQIGVIETKTRSHTYNYYPTIYLSVRKYKALKFYSDKGLAAYFMPVFSDCAAFVDIRNVAPTQVKRLGRKDRTNAPNDLEPMIEVPITKLKVLKSSENAPPKM